MIILLLLLLLLLLILLSYYYFAIIVIITIITIVIIIVVVIIIVLVSFSTNLFYLFISRLAPLPTWGWLVVASFIRAIKRPLYGWVTWTHKQVKK
jgi:hypothetical protein